MSVFGNDLDVSLALSIPLIDLSV